MVEECSCHCSWSENVVTIHLKMSIDYGSFKDYILVLIGCIVEHIYYSKTVLPYTHFHSYSLLANYCESLTLLMVSRPEKQCLIRFY